MLSACVLAMVEWNTGVPSLEYGTIYCQAHLANDTVSELWENDVGFTATREKVPWRKDIVLRVLR